MFLIILQKQGRALLLYPTKPLTHTHTRAHVCMCAMCCVRASASDSICYLLLKLLERPIPPAGDVPAARLRGDGKVACDSEPIEVKLCTRMCVREHVFVCVSASALACTRACAYAWAAM